MTKSCGGTSSDTYTVDEIKPHQSESPHVLVSDISGILPTYTKIISIDLENSNRGELSRRERCRGTKISSATSDDCVQSLYCSLFSVTLNLEESCASAAPAPRRREKYTSVTGI